MLGILVRSLPAPVKSIAKRLRSRIRAGRRLVGTTVSRDDIVRALHDAGINSGDTVVVHSSLSRIGKIDGGAATVCDALMECVGTPQGTILVPAFCPSEYAVRRSNEGAPIDLRMEPSQTGALTEVFRRHPAAKRSSHPFSSMVAVGSEAEYLCGSHDTDPRICHADSPLGRLRNVHGKILGIGVHLGPVSFYHVVEDTWDEFPCPTYSSDVPVIDYIDTSGRHVSRPVAYLDRSISKVRIDRIEGIPLRDFLTNHLRARGILHEFKIGEANSWWMQCEDLYEEMKALARRGITIYSSKEQLDTPHTAAALV